MLLLLRPQRQHRLVLLTERVGELPTQPLGLTEGAQQEKVALRHLGVNDVFMPASPQNVWRAIQAAKGDSA